MVLISILNKYINILKENSKTTTPTLDCKILLSYVLGVDVFELYKYFNSDFNKEELLKKLINRRINGEPISKIINKKSFWEYDFYVDNNVLDPRPDSESLIELLINEYDLNSEHTIIDFGTGSGCLILTLLKIFKNWNGVGVDISDKALTIAKKNANNLNINNITFIKSNWNDNITDKFDIIISNPPYIKTDIINNLDKDVKDFDPILALDGGIDGLDAYKYIAKHIIKNCKNDTKLYFEVGHDQAEDVINIFKNNNFIFNKMQKDLNNYNRIVSFKIK